MSTSLPQKIYSAHASPEARLSFRLARRLLSGVLVLFSLLVAAPIALLFFTTSVPLYLSLVFALAYLCVFFVVFRVKRTALLILLGLCAILLLSATAVSVSQGFAATPLIVDAQGGALCNSVASLESVTLGGSQQWVTIRGVDVQKPVLLFLAGGPGGSELVMTRTYLAELEKHFIVVNWDQPGTGKSYDAVNISTLTPERFVSDAYELTLLLRERFEQDKIYVLGESWGTILGIWLVQAHPELFHAYIGAGQMVSTTENDLLGYEFALDYLTQQGQVERADALRRAGPPPYTGADLSMQYMAYLNVLNAYMHAHAHGEGVGHNLLFDSLLAPEYGLIDKVNWVRGLSEVFTNVYPQLAGLDFRTQAARLEVPVYFIEGRWDVNAMTSLVEQYYEILDAPHKELIWFEAAAHPPIWDEPAHFVDVMVNHVLVQTQNPQAPQPLSDESEVLFHIDLNASDAC